MKSIKGYNLVIKLVISVKLVNNFVNSEIHFIEMLVDI